MVELNRAFHFTAFELSPSDLVLSELRRLWTLATPYISDRFVLPEGRARTVAEHDKIIRALREHDRPALQAAATHHRRQRQVLVDAVLNLELDTVPAHEH